MVAYEMIQNLKDIYEGQARQERYETSKALFQCKMNEGSQVGAHVIKMMGYIQMLEKLGFALNDELAIDVVLQSLPDSFSQFILNFNMNEIEKTLPQLQGKLRTAEGIMKKGGSKSVLMVREAKGRYGYKYLMPHKSEALEKFKEFKNEVQNQHGKSIKALRSDRGGEYLSQNFDELLKECGIVSQLTPPGTPQWNGVSERRNRTLLDMVRSMMSHIDLPTSFWGYALETAAFTLNRVPSKSVQKTPHEETKGYYFYNENKVFVARNGVFLEKEFLTNSEKGRNIEHKEVQQQQDIEPEVEGISQAVEENPTDLETQPLRRSTRER
ncbi:hypothetical protein GQ457_18G012180 [Hibiscus cannabinus]